MDFQNLKVPFYSKQYYKTLPLTRIFSYVDLLQYQNSRYKRTPCTTSHAKSFSLGSLFYQTYCLKILKRNFVKFAQKLVIAKTSSHYLKFRFFQIHLNQFSQFHSDFLSFLQIYLDFARFLPLAVVLQ